MQSSSWGLERWQISAAVRATATLCLSFPTQETGLMVLTALGELWDLLRARADGEVEGTVLHDLDVGMRDVLVKT